MTTENHINLSEPLITVVTVVLDDEENLKKTIQSYISQTFEKKEYILIDGGSSFGTIEMIRRYISDIDLFISEHDQGIYDAMNKGITHAKGRWVIFMNAGDIFFDADVLKNSAKELSGDLVYGNHAIYKESVDDFNLIDVSYLSDVRNIPFCHQAVFTRKELLIKYPFDLIYMIAADYDQYQKIKSDGALIKHIPITIAKILDGGFSARSRNILIKEYFEIMKKTKPFYSYWIYYLRKLKYVLFGN